MLLLNGAIVATERRYGEERRVSHASCLDWVQGLQHLVGMGMGMEMGMDAMVMVMDMALQYVGLD